MKIDYKIKKRFKKQIDNFNYECIMVSSLLKKPYELSFKTLNVFDTIYVIKSNNNLIGAGEVTALPGYSDDTIESLWDYHVKYFSKSKNIGSELASGFAGSAIKTCLEAYDEKLLYSDKQYKVGTACFFDNLEKNNLKEKVHVTKIKIGKDVSRDIARVRQAQSEGYKIRVDANQGYSVHDAKVFLSSIDSDGVEYVEQLVDRRAWSDMAELKRCFPNFTFLLDESICTIGDIDIANNFDAGSAIKLKLFKCGSISETVGLAEYALSKGFEVVLGNGVQTILGALYESICFERLKGHDMFNKYSEINGPQKIVGYNSVSNNYIDIKAKGSLSLIKDIME